MLSETLHELIDTLAQTPGTIAARIGNICSEDTRRRKADYFSVVENICHLRDLEVEGYAVRIDRILNEEQPFLPDIDGGRLAIERDYNNQNVQDALAAFAIARESNVHALRKLAPEHLTREGTLEGVGPVTLEKVLLMMQEHDQGHVEDLLIAGRAVSEFASERNP